MEEEEEPETIWDFPHLLKQKKKKNHNIYIKPNIFPRIFYDFLLAKSERGEDWWWAKGKAKR